MRHDFHFSFMLRQWKKEKKKRKNRAKNQIQDKTDGYMAVYKLVNGFLLVGGIENINLQLCTFVCVCVKAMNKLMNQFQNHFVSDIVIDDGNDVDLKRPSKWKYPDFILQ